MAGNHRHDLAAVIADLEAQGRLARVRSEVDLKHELAGIAAALAGGPRAVLFEKAKGQRWPVLAGLYGSRALAAAALGQEEASLARHLAQRIAAWQRAPGEPRVVKSGPVLDVTEPDVDLGKLPIPVHALKDAGPYIAAAVAIAKDPDGSGRSAAMPRCQVVGRNALHVHVEAGSILEAYLERAKRRGRSLWVTFNLGAGPALQLAALAPASAADNGGDALGLAGEIAGAPLDLVPGTESDVEMAADSMWSLECEIIPGEYAPEGPFGESAGYYAKAQPRPVAHVRRVHRRAAPLFHTILSGAEARTCAGLIGEASVLAELQRLVPGVRDVHFTQGGAGLYHAVVQIEQRGAGWPKQAILAAFAAYPPLKMVTVVDDDVDIRDARDVEWAMATRLDPGAGIVTIGNAIGDAVNPSFAGRLGAKVGFDATRPFPKRSDYERVAFKAVELAAYDLAGGEAKTVKPAARAADPAAAPARPAAPSSDYDTNRIWERELAEWKKKDAADAEEEAPGRPAKAAKSDDWDENRWLKRELEEMKRERAGKVASPPKAAPAKAQPAQAPRAAESVMPRAGSSDRSPSSDWDENRWLARELEEMKREADGRRPSPPKAAPRPPARSAAPARAETRAPIEARAADGRGAENRGDDDDGGFFRGGAV